jgi:hypothetical protein
MGEQGTRRCTGALSPKPLRRQTDPLRRLLENPSRNPAFSSHGWVAVAAVAALFPPPPSNAPLEFCQTTLASGAVRPRKLTEFNVKSSFFRKKASAL